MKQADTTAEKKPLSKGRPASSKGQAAEPTWWRRLLAEFVGTYGLVTIGAGPVVVAAASGGTPGVPFQVVAPGILVMAMIYSIGTISGAHINPAVTLAFALRSDFPWHRVPGYWAAQLAGSLAAAGVLYWFFGPAGHVGATLPKHGVLAPFGLEVICTFLLVTVILATAANARIAGTNAAIAVGGTVALDGLFAGPISGASMNPARSFGPALLGGEAGTLWIYFLAPLLGAVLAVVIAWLLRGETNPQARESATGT